jgi:hypothetical protein
MEQKTMFKSGPAVPMLNVELSSRREFCQKYTEWQLTGIVLEEYGCNDDFDFIYPNSYNDAGIRLGVAAFGAESKPQSSGNDAIDLANKLAAFVIRYGLQGVDVE